MTNVSVIQSPSYWKKILIMVLVVEAIIGGLIWIDPLFAVLVPVGLLGFTLFLYVLVQKPFVWISLMIVTSGLDLWGQIAGGITAFHLSWGFGILSAISFYMFYHYDEVKLNTPINKYVFAYVGFSLFSLIYSPNVESGLLFLATTCALFIFYILVLNFIKSKNQFKIIVLLLLATNILIAVVTFYQLLNFDEWNIVNATQAASGEKISRSSGTFHDPNVAATYLMVGIIFSVSIIFYSRESKLLKLFMLGAAFISFMGMLATFSRTGWLSLAVGLFTLLLFQKKKKNILYAFLIFLFLFTAFILFTPYGQFISHRLESLVNLMGDVSIRTRIYMSISGLWMFFDNPVLGVGYRGFPLLYDFYIHPEAPQLLLYVKESHTLIITLLAEGGVLAVGIVFFWFKKVFEDNMALLREFSESDIIRAILIGCFANFVALNLNFFFYGSLFPHFNLIWVIFGLIYSIYYNKQVIMGERNESK